MYDRELAKEILHQIFRASRTILKRFEPIESPDDFAASESGMEKMDAICMQLVAIGESLKNLDKITNKALLPQYTQVDWKKAKGMRDIISHHYFDLNAEAIFTVCKEKIEPLANTVKRMLEDLD
ncbi:MAG: DUF86 domain-containing protein [Candidatus Latescibacteria bacterium]|nr:DUF86 domain-containing protein [Candidatus Latescibacterota bacterium]